jgi:hypothetical protein
MAAIPRSGTRHAWRSTLVKTWIVAAAYLRAAHAYILISMPTGTSTIRGVFQAILALLVNRTHFALAHKVMPFKKFASEIFSSKPLRFYAALQQQFTYLCGPASNQRRINRFRVVRINPVLTWFDVIRQKSG